MEINDPKCQGCESTENVTFEEDPYAAEIGNDHTPVYMCEKCRIEAANDI